MFQFPRCSMLLSRYLMLSSSASFLSRSCNCLMRAHNFICFVSRIRVATSPNLRNMQKLSFEFWNAAKRGMPCSLSSTKWNYSSVQFTTICIALCSLRLLCRIRWYPRSYLGCAGPSGGEFEERRGGSLVKKRRQPSWVDGHRGTSISSA